MTETAARPGDFTETSRVRAARAPRTGDRVRIERDDSLYPSHGTWPQFRGRVGTVVEINRDRRRPHSTEYGVVFTRVCKRTDGRGGFRHDGDVSWFKAYELSLRVGAASQRAVESPETEHR